MREPKNITVVDLFEEAVKKYPDINAYQQGSIVITWKQADVFSDYIAAALKSKGVKRHSHIGIMTGEDLNTFLFIIAALKLGAVCVMFNAGLSEKELYKQAILADTDFFALGDMVKCNSPEDTFVGSGLDTDHKKVFSLADYSDRFTTVNILLGIGHNICHKEKLITEKPVAADTAFILFTSGTTSDSKAVPITHLMLANTASLQAEDLNYTHKDKVCSTLPVSHCFCICVNFAASMAKGACLALPEKRSTDEILNTLKTGCTVLNAVPAMYLKIINKTDGDKSGLSLRTGIIGGDSYDMETFRNIEEKLGITLMCSLGQTECTAGITVCYAADSFETRATTLGHFMDSVDGVIRDVKTGKILGTDEIGEICVKGFGVMAGYYKSPQLTAQVFDSDGFLHTGDLGFIDKCGNIHYCGRLKNIIVRGGENISPLEIESILMESGLPFKEVCVVGVPSSRYGEEVAVCAVAKNSKKPSLKHVLKALEHRLACYQMPAHICYFDEFPRTASGKIKRHLLKELIVENLKI